MLCKERASQYMPVDQKSLTVPPPCDTSLHEMLNADIERAMENQAIREKLIVCGDQTMKVKSPGSQQLFELQKAFGNIDIDNLGLIDIVKVMVQVLQTPVKNRTPDKLNRVMPFVKELSFFRDKGLKDCSITETLSLMTYREAEADESIIQYDTFGDEFYVILEGECEVMIPDKKQEEVKAMIFELIQLEAKLKDTMKSVESIK